MQALPLVKPGTPSRIFSKEIVPERPPLFSEIDICNLSPQQKEHLSVIEHTLKSHGLCDPKFKNFLQWYFANQLHFTPEQSERLYKRLNSIHLFNELNFKEANSFDFNPTSHNHAQCIKLILESLVDTLVSFEKISLPGADLSHANLSWSNFKSSNLSQANLDSANLYGACFVEANLNRSHLEGSFLGEADCSYSNFEESHFLRSDLTDSDFSHAKLDYSHISFTDLTRSTLKEANCKEVKFNYVTLTYADLKKSNFANSELNHINLDNADLEHADFHGVKFVSATLEKANLRHVSLYRAELQYARLFHADLSYSNLRGADLSHADLKFATMHQVDITRADFTGAELDHTLISIEFPIFFDKQLAKYYFSKESNRKNLLFTVDSIDDKYSVLKIRLMESIIERLNNGTDEEKKYTLKYMDDFKGFLCKQDSIYLESKLIVKFIGSSG